MVDVLDKILQKKELRGISRSFAQEQLDLFLQAHPTLLKQYQEKPDSFVKSKSFKQVQSGVREILRRYYGVFFLPEYVKKREKAVQHLIDKPDIEHVQQVLSLHRSTFERAPYYDFLYDQFFDIIGTPKRVLDIGCGFNPFSCLYMNEMPEYHCADIACADLERIGMFMKSLTASYSTHCIDCSDTDLLQNLPEVDVVFAFKVIDTLEDVRPGCTEKILDALRAKYLIVSFPTRSIGQAKHIRPREWFERLVTDKVLERVTLPNEQFLIITL